MRNSSGFTLIELLIVVAIIGIIAAVAVPQLSTAMNKGKQNATIADIRQIATAVERFHIEEDAFPDVDDINELAGLVEPEFTPQLKRKDAWGNQFYFKGSTRSYTIASCGKAGPEVCSAPQQKPYETVFDAIIFANGAFIQGPEP